MKVEKKEAAEVFKIGLDTGVRMLSELIGEFLEVGVKIGCGTDIPVEAMRQFINEYAISLYAGKIPFDEMKATIKAGAVEAKQHVDDESGVVH